MDLFAAAGRLMAMDDAAWARHANPASVWTRIAGGTVLFLALWSPMWIGFWGVVPILLAAAWTWLNPRLFPPPSHARAWATRAVLGERAFLRRAEIPIPDHHRRAGLATTGLALAFLVAAAIGFWQRDVLLAVTAWHAATIAKLWFCDRMVWLWQDVRGSNDLYRRWDAADFATP